MRLSEYFVVEARCSMPVGPGFDSLPVWFAGAFSNILIHRSAWPDCVKFGKPSGCTYAMLMQVKPVFVPSRQTGSWGISDLPSNLTFIRVSNCLLCLSQMRIFICHCLASTRDPLEVGFEEHFLSGHAQFVMSSQMYPLVGCYLPVTTRVVGEHDILGIKNYVLCETFRGYRRFTESGKHSGCQAAMPGEPTQAHTLILFGGAIPLQPCLYRTNNLVLLSTSILTSFRRRCRLVSLWACCVPAVWEFGADISIAWMDFLRDYRLGSDLRVTLQSQEASPELTGGLSPGASPGARSGRGSSYQMAEDVFVSMGVLKCGGVRHWIRRENSCFGFC